MFKADGSFLVHDDAGGPEDVPPPFRLERRGRVSHWMWIENASTGVDFPFNSSSRRSACG
jgi:hypothetical protein